MTEALETFLDLCTSRLLQYNKHCASSKRPFDTWHVFSTPTCAEASCLHPISFKVSFSSKPMLGIPKPLNPVPLKRWCLYVESCFSVISCIIRNLRALQRRDSRNFMTRLGDLYRKNGSLRIEWAKDWESFAISLMPDCLFHSQ